MEHPRNIVLVRHGETPANAADRTGRFFDTAKDIAMLGGKADHELPLTEQGRRQAQRIGLMMAERWPFRRFDVCYDSGFLRSIETLDLVLEAYPGQSDAGCERVSHLDLRERDTGYPYFLTLDEGRRLFPWWERYEQLVGPIYSRPPGGESIADAWLRVHMFLNSVRRSRQGQDLLVVSHGRIMLGFKYWIERHPAKDANRLYAEHEKIANGTAWWYRRTDDDKAYRLEGVLVPDVAPNP
jgi:broad specificity phosphatase PhoE